MSTSSTGWVTEYYAAWDRADADQIMQWFTDDIVLEDVPTGHIATGVAQARAFVEHAIAMTPGTTYEIVHSAVTDDAFATEWIMRPAGLRGSSVGTIRDGRITSNRDYWNAASVR
ncbi:nuclear transport factor 2 family protein [Gordonia humi]|uniref:Ketosteroid isomerase-like protein n=1 Tax=Gordonia humi TaxID=686429 RepID=A0A840ETV6_9ACTN|nr:nuclear transport factor 2 family protein [Gordonia humi]MBB4135132.1 ketosteroid isomerase-like protein [Gordonia humi]